MQIWNTPYNLKRPLVHHLQKCRHAHTKKCILLHRLVLVMHVPSSSIHGLLAIDTTGLSRARSREKAGRWYQCRTFSRIAVVRVGKTKLVKVKIYRLQLQNPRMQGSLSTKQPKHPRQILLYLLVTCTYGTAYRLLLEFGSYSCANEKPEQLPKKMATRLP